MTSSNVETVAWLLLLVPGTVVGLRLLLVAFEDSTEQGMLVLFVPFYWLYFAIARDDSPRKYYWLSFGLTSSVTGILVLGLTSLSPPRHSFHVEPEEEARLVDRALPADAVVGSCDALASWSICLDFRNAGVATLGPDDGQAWRAAERRCREVAGTAGSVSRRPCARERLVGTCDPGHAAPLVRYYDRGGQSFNAESAARDCAGQHGGEFAGSGTPSDDAGPDAEARPTSP